MFTVPKPEKKRSKSLLPEEDDELIQIENQLEALKSSNPKDLNEFNKEVTSLVNKKRDTLNTLRKKYKIKVDGDCPAPLFSFPQMAKALKSKYFMQTIKSCGYKKPTPVQM